MKAKAVKAKVVKAKTAGAEAEVKVKAPCPQNSLCLQ